MYSYAFGSHTALQVLGLSKTADIASRGYMGGDGTGGASSTAENLVDRVAPHLTLRNLGYYGMPAVYGAVAGAEDLPEHKILGATLGAGGAAGGSHLGGMLAQAAGVKGNLFIEPIIRLLAANAGHSLATRAGHLMTE